MKKRFGVFVGRMSPIHLGHEEVLKATLKDVEKLIIVIGSANQPRTIKNPWDAEERAQMISKALEPVQASYVYLSDRPYAETIWLSDLQNKVAQITDYAEDTDIGLVVCKTDISSSYLDGIPQWEHLCYNLKVPVHATQIREKFFTYDVGYKEYLHLKVVEYMEAFYKTEDFKQLKNEFDFIANYKNEWVGSPYPPTFVCSDVVCIRSGHVLLVKRKHSPGKGLWALPGGFVGQDELIVDAAIRELQEETSITQSAVKLKSSIVETKVFDSPGRSLRGRTISHAFSIKLDNGKLDKVKAADDAADCKWFPMDEARSMEEELFEDHHAILTYFASRT
jgi:bifunctional NMN adenylyltransferase/nudix hydrolase